MDSSSGIVAFLLTDIVGSTGLWESNPREMSQALAEHDRILRQEIGENRGHVFSTAGDSFAAVFPSVVDAAHAAVGAQVMLANVSVLDQRLAVRSAIHVGEAEVRDGDYFGPTVNRCARLMGIAHGGQVLISDPAARILSSADSAVQLDEVGRFELRGFEAPETVHQIADPNLRTDPPDQAPMKKAKTNLPSYLLRLFGRDHDCHRIIELMGTERVITITGAAGTGKTRLALQVAVQTLDEPDREAWVADLTPVDSPDRVVEALLRALPVSLQDSRPPLTIARSYLEQRSCTLLVDNCEHVLDGASGLVSELIDACPRLTVLATSRERLGIHEEQVYPLGPLATPTLDDEGMTVPSVALFVDRARRSNPSFGLTKANGPAVAKICRMLDGLPLAIELAAARVSVIPPDQLAEMLSERLQILRTDRRDVQPHHRTLAAALEWSYQLLAKTDRLLFERLSVFPASFGLGDAIAISTDEGVSDFETLEGIGRLSEKSLLRTNDAGRLVSLETIRQYGRLKLQERGEERVFEVRHAAHYADMVERLEQELRINEVSALSQYETERDNILAAIARTVHSDDSSLAARIYGALRSLWWSHGQPVAAMEWGRTLANAQHSTLVGGRALHTAGTVAYRMSPALAEGYLEKAEELLRLSPEPEARVELGRVLISSAAAVAKDLSQMDEICREALDLAERTGDTLGASIALMNLSIVASRTGDLTESVSLAERGLAYARRAGQPSRISEALEGLGNAELDAGQIERARSHLAEALALATESDHIPTITTASHGLLRIALHESDVDAATSAALGFLERIEYAMTDAAIQFLVDVADLLLQLEQEPAAESTIRYVEHVIQETGWDIFPQLADSIESVRSGLAEPGSATDWSNPETIEVLQAQIVEALQSSKDKAT